MGIAAVKASTGAKSKTLVEKISGRVARILKHPDFDDPSMVKEILGPMPSMESYLEKKRQVQTQAAKSLVPEYLRPCYDEPILTREQEFHIFRRYNFYKHRASLHLEAGNLMYASKELKLADACRKTLTSANVRLCIPLLKKYQTYRHYEDLVGEAYFLICRAVEYFDWTRGVKFCTYATWTIHRTLGRTVSDFMTYDSQFSIGEDGFENQIESTSHAIEDELRQIQYRKVLSELMSDLPHREKEILDRRFFQEQTLDHIGSQMGISKERVRQIQNRAMEYLKNKVESMGMSPESIL